MVDDYNVIPSLVGAVGFLAQMLNGALTGQTSITPARAAMGLVVGVFLGFMGGVICTAINHPELSSLVAGGLGSAGTSGPLLLGRIIQRITGMPK